MPHLHKSVPGKPRFGRPGGRRAVAIIRRLAFFLLAFLLLSILIFLLLRVLPGDQALLVAGINSTPAEVAAARKRLGLDQPYIQQYGHWLLGIFQGNWGTSTLTGETVASQIAQRSQITFPLIILSLIIALALGLPLGISSASSRHPAVQNAYRIVAIVAAAIPALWLGLLLIMLLGKGIGLIGLFPVSGFPDQGWAQPGQALLSLILPAASVGIITAASILRYTRSGLLELAESDYVALSMAAGMTRKEAIRKTALRLILPQLISVFGMTFASMVTGVLVVEQLFALPGLSGMLMRDIQNRDLLAAQSEIMLLAALFFLVGLIVDIVHSLLDPRLVLEAAEGDEPR